MIILPQELIAKHLQEIANNSQVSISLVSLDDGDAFVSNQLVNEDGKKRRLINGILKFTFESQNTELSDFSAGIDVLVVVRLAENFASTEQHSLSNLQFNGWVRTKEGIEPRPVQIVPVREELFARVHGLYETEVLQEKTVLIIGLGSGGSSQAIELVKAGVGNFILIDHDRLEVGNVVRHLCGLSDLGRYKTKAVRDLILDKNPFANVETHEFRCDWEWLLKLQQLVRRADLVFCSTDNRASRMVVNRACVSEGRVCIYGGTFRRAYGGQVLRVIPGQTMCYQCFVDILPDIAEDQEIASQEQADRIAYADRPVPIEPGLATDIASITLMSVKLGILELLRGTETTLASLYEDLSSPWFLWLNRREADTQYADLNPMNESGDGPRILTWYGIESEKNSGCPVCGDFIGQQLKQGNILEKPTPEQIAAFGASSM